MTLDHIDIVLPWPDTMLFPNRRRGSFRKFQPYIEAARRSGFHCARLALGRNTIRLGARNHVRLLFGMPDRRNRDLDGCVGAIKQDADVVMMVYRDEYYHEDSPYKGLAEILIRKQRMGPLGEVFLAFQGQHSRFLDADQQAVIEARNAMQFKPKQKYSQLRD